MPGFVRGGRGLLLLLGLFMVPPFPARVGWGRPDSLEGLLEGPGAAPAMAPGLPVTALESPELPAEPMRFSPEVLLLRCHCPMSLDGKIQLHCSECHRAL